MTKKPRIWRSLAAAAVLLAGVSVIARSADHADSPAIASDAMADINDLYAFLSPTDANRLVLAMTVSPFIPPTEAGTAYFSPDVLYQFKIDTDGDAIEDMVVQIQFDQPGPDQRFTVFGPVRPSSTGPRGNVIVADAATVGGRISTTPVAEVESDNGVMAFAGIREDPFFFDFEQFVAVLGGSAGGFRSLGIDTFAGMNALAIVVELPISMLGGSTNLGVWVTTSRP